MSRFLRCPFCGYKTDVHNKHLGEELKCMACNETLDSFKRKAPGKSKSQVKTEQEPSPKVVKGPLGDPSLAVEGALPGALGGILAGVVGTVVAGAFSEMYLGEIVALLFLGFALGLVLGALLGTLFRVIARRLNADFRLKPGVAVLIGGGIIGSAVSAILVRYQWIPVGTGAGSLGTFLWVFLSSKIEPTLQPLKPPSDEDDYFLNKTQGNKPGRSPKTVQDSLERENGFLDYPKKAEGKRNRE
ncbi:MAG TPA: hypothetical protein VGZ25_02930 [Gemmataceae bacterium]|nr:hypothetical protein [Gemmataceae bacterium]